MHCVAKIQLGEKHIFHPLVKREYNKIPLLLKGGLYVTFIPLGTGEGCIVNFFKKNSTAKAKNQVLMKKKKTLACTTLRRN